MANEDKQVCPECKGQKVIPGNCVCNMEWRGTMIGDEMDDCQCSQEVECPMCRGTGFIAEEER